MEGRWDGGKRKTDTVALVRPMIRPFGEKFQCCDNMKCVPFVSPVARCLKCRRRRRPDPSKSASALAPCLAKRRKFSGQTKEKEDGKESKILNQVKEGAFGRLVFFPLPGQHFKYSGGEVTPLDTYADISKVAF